MGNPQSEKGSRRERELVNRIHDREYGVTKIPASGSATNRELPDILCGNGDNYYAIEAKSSSGDPIYLDGEEVENLVWFAQLFGAKPRIGARFDREDWYFFHPGDLYTTDSGNYRVKKEKALSDGTDIDELLGHSEQQRLDDL